MTNNAQFRKLAGPIVRADEELAFSRSAIVVVPIRHVIRAIEFNSTSSPTGFHLRAEITTVCGTSGTLPFGPYWVKQYWPRQHYYLSDQESF